jgi:GDP-4-dehydro-6-deoxy-D-mannose reductase
MKKLLLIGGTGFVGSHLSKACAEEYLIESTGREVDVRDPVQLKAVIQRVKPDNVVSLAAITTLRESFEDQRSTYDTNFTGTLNLLMALKDSNFSGQLLFVSSSEVYGLLNVGDLPVSEALLPKPMSPYAVAKMASEALCYQWSRYERFKIVIARPFNHIGPGQSERFAIADFARQIAKIKLGLEPPVITVGDIDTTRDFTDVRDIADAYHKLLNVGANGEIFNVCSGSERSIRFLIERMCQLAGVDVEIRKDAARFRLSDQRRVYGSNLKLIESTGWSYTFMLDQTLSDIIEYWIDRLKN